MPAGHDTVQIRCLFDLLSTRCCRIYVRHMQIYVATSNHGKLRDFAQAAASEGIAILPLPGLDAMPEPPEDAPDFAGNAAVKAVAYSLLAPGLLVLADDSGLEVDALGGQPGVRSARFADDLGFEANSGLPKDGRNNRCLLAQLGSLDATRQTPANRQARFVCALALARDGEVLYRATGTAAGEILDSPRGANGFGYDPLFLLHAEAKSMAELDPRAKWAHSHRGQAFQTLLQTLLHGS